MKKILLLLLVFQSSLSFSQTFFEDFENTTGPDALPSTNWTLSSGNWAVFDNGVGITQRWKIFNSTPPIYPPIVYSGINCAYVTGENNGATGATSEDYLATPLITIPANGQLRFYSRTFTSGDQGTIYQIKIAPSTGSQTNLSDYTLLQQYNENTLTNLFFNLYGENVIDLSSYAGQQVYIAFVKKYTQPYLPTVGDRWLIDDVKVQSAPTCEKPTTVTLVSATTTSATVAWTNNSSATSFEVIAIPVQNSINSPTASSTGIITSLNPYTITGLNPYTYYAIYVRAICSSTDKSDWSTALFTVTPQYNCPSPSSLQVSNINYTSATIAWTDTNATQWEIIALPNNSTPTNATAGIITSSNPYNYTGLNPDTQYHFFVRAVCSPTESSGWISSYPFSTLFYPPVCGGTFVDNGGSSGNYNYSNGNESVYTFCPDNAGDVVTISFNSFITEASWDALYVFNGNSIISPQIPSGNPAGNVPGGLAGGFWGNLNTNLPGPFTSSSADGCLTFRFVIDGSVTFPGWNANISCGSRDRITLFAFVDTNGNGIKDPDEVQFNNGSFVYDVNNSGVNNNIYAPTGTYTILDNNPTNTYNFSYELQSEYLPYYSVGSTSFNNITIPVGGGNQILYFPITLIQGYNDVTVSLIGSNATLGYRYVNYIYFRNKGNASSSGTITYTKPNLATIVNNSTYPANSGTTVLTSTGLTHTFTNLLPNESRFIVAVMSIPGLPILNIGDYLDSNVTISAPANDINLLNNSASVSQIVRASYDPNDKMESHGSTIPFEQFTSNDYLYYTIRFENTGTAPANKVRIEDVLDSKLDETTIRMIESSHNYTLNRIGTHLTWDFKNINLPVSIPDNDFGRGFVQFKIKPKPGYAVGDIIPNTASIYFDENPAIVTNTFNTEFIAALGNQSFEVADFILYPNPAKNNLFIQLNSTSGNIDSIVIYDVLGNKIKELQSVSANSTTLDVSNLAIGMYFVELKSDTNLKQTKKLIIK